MHDDQAAARTLVTAHIVGPQHVEMTQQLVQGRFVETGLLCLVGESCDRSVLFCVFDIVVIKLLTVMFGLLYLRLFCLNR